MQKTQGKKRTSFILSLMLSIAIALSVSGCNGRADNGRGDQDTPSSPASEQQADTRSETQTGDNVLGEGETQFDFTVTDLDGEETQFEIHTDKETVGEALQELGLIEGEEGDYGLYVKTVNGITVDYDKDGRYWAFYVNDEYAQTGVDSTEITEGDTYAFRVE